MKVVGFLSRILKVFKNYYVVKYFIRFENLI